MNKASRKAIRTRNSIVFHVFSIMLGFLMIYPLLWLIASSFKSNDTMFLNSYSLIPQEFSIAENYSSGWAGISGVTFGKFIINTVLVTIIGTITCVFSSLLAAYAFSRTPFRGIRIWFTCVILTMMIPPQVMVVPQYIILKQIGLVDTLTSLILPWCFGTAFFIFLILQFFRSIPKDLDEAVVRVKTISAPLNCKRLGCKTYCAEFGKCISLENGGNMPKGCHSDDRICINYTVMSKQRKKDRVKIILVNESLGY